jgi:hypothetical protein
VRRAEADALGNEPALYETFSGRVEMMCEDIRSFLRDRRLGGRRVAAYGASARGTMLLNV